MLSVASVSITQVVHSGPPPRPSHDARERSACIWCKTQERRWACLFRGQQTSPVRADMQKRDGAGIFSEGPPWPPRTRNAAGVRARLRGTGIDLPGAPRPFLGGNDDRGSPSIGPSPPRAGALRRDPDTTPPGKKIIVRTPPPSAVGRPPAEPNDPPRIRGIHSTGLWSDWLTTINRKADPVARVMPRSPPGHRAARKIPHPPAVGRQLDRPARA